MSMDGGQNGHIMAVNTPQGTQPLGHTHSVATVSASGCAADGSVPSYIIEENSLSYMYIYVEKMFRYILCSQSRDIETVVIGTMLTNTGYMIRHKRKR